VPLPTASFELRHLMLQHEERFRSEFNVSDIDDANNDDECAVAINETESESEGSPELETQLSPRSTFLPRTQPNQEIEHVYIAQCFGEPAPATFNIRATRITLRQSVDLRKKNDLSLLCISRVKSRAPGQEGTLLYNFALLLSDLSAQLEVAVPDTVAEELLGITAAKLMSPALPARKGAIEKLRILASGETGGRVQLKSAVLRNRKIFIVESIILG
jgi:hypothetical protein